MARVAAKLSFRARRVVHELPLSESSIQKETNNICPELGPRLWGHTGEISVTLKVRVLGRASSEGSQEFERLVEF